MRDKHYKTFSIRLDDSLIIELKRKKEHYKSWNLLIRDLLNNQKKGKYERNNK